LLRRLANQHAGPSLRFEPGSDNGIDQAFVWIKMASRLVQALPELGVPLNQQKAAVLLNGGGNGALGFQRTAWFMAKRQQKHGVIVAVPSHVRLRWRLHHK